LIEIFPCFDLQAFVHDPLINWRLFNFNEVPNVGNAYVHPIVNSEEPNLQSKDLAHPPRGARERELLQVIFSSSQPIIELI
jgi:serine/threonine-protein kinase mTOR